MKGRRLRPLADARRLNATDWRTLDRVAQDPRVAEVWAEADGGVWLALAPGWNHGGAGSVRADGFRYDDHGNVLGRRSASEIRQLLLEDLEDVTAGDHW